MPKPKLPREVVDTVVELLLCGWTPQDVVASWPSWGHYDLNCPSLVSIRGIASAEGLGRPRGAQPGRPRPQGAGRKFSGGKGTGTKYSTRRDEVRRLRSEGLSHQTIAGLVGVSRQQVANLLSDGS